MMKGLILAALMAGSTLLVGACAEMRWTRPGADSAAVSRDLDECRASALRQRAPQGGAGVPPDQPVERGDAGVGAKPAATVNERFIADHEVVRICMERRGYRLQPAQ